jgi:V/A-type H+-transporting ATPase subunit K
MSLEPSTLAILGGVLAQVGGIAGSSIGIGIAASAGAATLAEDPKQFRSVTVLAALPMTQTFYALIVLVLIITAVVPKLPAEGSAGLSVLVIGLITGAAEFFSAWYQGVICASAISVLPKTKGGIFVPGIVLAALVELLGQLGMVFAIMSLTMLGLM